MSNLTLLFGMPRSGTSWLGKIFDSHENTLYRHEPDDRGLLNFMPFFPTADDDAALAPGVAAFLDELWSRTEEKVVDSLPLFPKSYLSAPVRALRSAAVAARKVAPRWVGMFPGPAHYQRLRGTGVHMVWKSIESLGRLGAVARIAPDSRGILILRHPCGFVASTLKGESGGKFEGNFAAAQDWPIFERMLATPAALQAGLDLAAVKSMTEPERLALRWALHCEHAEREVTGIDRVQTVRYEDVCFDTHPMVERLFSHCGLHVGAQTRDFIDHSISREKSGYYSVVKDPKRSATKWQSELTSAQIEQVLGVTRRFHVGRHYPQ